ncbi:MAG: DUF5916 domain-containing protein, partial [Gemmatimonadota bacterium]
MPGNDTPWDPDHEHRSLARSVILAWAALLALALGFLATPVFAAGQVLPADTLSTVATAAGTGALRLSSRGTPVILASRILGASPFIDGRLDEALWAQAEVATSFVQRQPYDGAPASQDTEVRVLYGEDALYVGFRLFDTAADSIVGHLTRRDQQSVSDWARVAVDSYNDRRTAFQFAVNPAGVKQDIYHFNDTEEDTGWDAVWDVAAQMDEAGWTAEFRIPYSQLRFGQDSVQTWGVNFAREISRHNEMSVWAPLPRDENRMVSLFGELHGLEGLGQPRRMELQPYTRFRARRGPGDAANPFHQPTLTAGTVGVDLKYGVTNNLTLDATVNPDFGQVEADPSQVNLTAFETFLPERRPFFLEGARSVSGQWGEPRYEHHGCQIRGGAP